VTLFKLDQFRVILLTQPTQKIKLKFQGALDRFENGTAMSFVLGKTV